MVHVGVAQAIRAGQATQLAKADLSAARVLEELRRIAFVDARDFWRSAGTLKPVGELTAEQGACLASFEAIIKNAAAGDNKQATSASRNRTVAQSLRSSVEGFSNETDVLPVGQIYIRARYRAAGFEGELEVGNF